MQYVVSIDDVANAVIIEWHGKHLGGDDTNDLLQLIREHLKAERKRFIFDLTGLKWVNSVGLGCLISALDTIKNSGGQLVLCNYHNVDAILTITRLKGYILTFESRDLAVAHMANAS